jgi:phage/plasmid-associated DNA primase
MAGHGTHDDDMLGNESVDDVVQRATMPAVQSLYRFVQSPDKGFITKSKDPRTNFIDMRQKRCYIFPDDQIPAFFRHYWSAYEGGRPVMGFAERQGTDANPYSGLAFDFDLYMKSDRSAAVRREVGRVVTSVCTTASAHMEKNDMSTYAFVLMRPQVTQTKIQGYPDQVYKFGFHILVPGMMATRSYKKYLMRELCDKPALLRALESFDLVTPIDKCVDQGYASNPVLLLGSSKEGGLTYELTDMYHITVDSTDDAVATVQVLRRDDVSGYNMAWELSLNYEAMYPDKEPLIPMRKMKLLTSVEAEATKFAERTAGGRISEEDLESVDREIDFISATDPNARLIKLLLDVLGPEYYEHRDKWRNVVFAVANTSPRYFSLVKAFSQRCPEKYDEKALETLWQEAVNARTSNNVRRPLTLASLKYMARTSNPAKYAQAIQKDAFTMLSKCVYSQNGAVGHYQFAKILYTMFNDQFVTCPNLTGRGGVNYTWYEFMFPGKRDLQPGEVWKWCERGPEPESLCEYISEGLNPLMQSMREDIKSKLSAATEKELIKYYRGLSTRFTNVMVSLNDNGFKRGIVKEAAHLFLKRSFAKKLDKDGSLMGVGNGVLKLGKTVEFINHYHEHLVSAHTPVNYKPFDPQDPDTQKVLNYFKTIIPERDARLKIVMGFAAILDGWQKDPEFTIFCAAGQNGKTTLMNILKKVLGMYGDTINPGVLTGDPPSADKPNSAIANTYNKRFLYCEEIGRGQALNAATVKLMNSPGEISCRDLHKPQSSHMVTWRMWLCSNFLPVLDSKDYALLRRIVLYNFKIKFTSHPQAPNERQEDPQIGSKWVNDDGILEAFLSILVYFYGQLQLHYGGNIKLVKSPTMEAETQAYFNKNDYVNKFITNMMVESPNVDSQIPLSQVAIAYRSWLSAIENIDKKTHHDTNTIQLEFMDHPIIQKRFLKIGPDGSASLVKCRILSKDNMALGPDEASLNVVEQKAAVYGAEVAEPEEWWVISDAPPRLNVELPRAAPRDSDYDLVDDFQMLRIERSHKREEQKQELDDELGL